MLPSRAMTINGEYLETLIEGYRTIDVSGREMPEIEQDTIEVGFTDGVRYKQKRYKERKIKVTFTITGQTTPITREELNLKLRQLNGILDAENAEFTFEDEPDVFYVGTVEGSSDGSVAMGYATENGVASGTFTILCPKPYKYSITEYEAEPSIDEKGAIFIDYNGTYKSYPILEADFYNEVEGDAELTGHGDCGYVAFFNEQEKIIQLGDPEEEDGEAVYDKSQTLVNQTFEESSSWGTSVSSLWTVNGGKILPDDAIQNGTIGMKVAQYAVPASPKTTTATVLNRKQTPNGRPKFYYTVTLRCTGRTSNAITVSATITASLGNDKSYFGKGLGVQGSIYCGGSWHNVTIKGKSSYWKGRTAHTVSTSFTVTGLSSTTSVLTGIKFKATRTDNLLDNKAGILSETSCSNMSISTYVADVPEKYYLAATSYGSGSDKYHGVTITRTLPADAAGETGATDFTFTYKQQMCIGNDSSDQIQVGDFQALVVSGSGSSRKILAGVRIYKGSAGKMANLDFYINGKKQTVDGVPSKIDLSYANKYFGTSNSAVRTTTITKSGSTITFNVAGIKATFKDSAYTSLKATQITFAFNQYSTIKPLTYNGLYWVKFIKDNCDVWKNIPNKFSANDVLEANCGEGEVYLNGTRNPGLGAIGNNWEDFYLKPGLNQIGYAYSSWVEDEYAPTIKVRYREVFL